MKASFERGRIDRLWFTFSFCFALLPLGRAEDEQSTNPVPEVVEPSPPPPAPPFISPFSGVAVPDYSYTNRDMSLVPPFLNRGLTIDPFSRTPLTPPAPEPIVEIVPYVELPVIWDLPPGTTVQHIAIPPAAAPTPTPAHPAATESTRESPPPLAFAIEFAEPERLDFPPGTILRHGER